MPTLKPVQALRAVAAWLVVITHGALWAGAYGSLGFAPRVYGMLGSLGVLMFFTVSGFIMILIGDGNFGRTGAATSFIRRRLIRIVPLYWLMTLLALAVMVRNGEAVKVGPLIQSLLFLPHLDNNLEMRPVLGVGWTLNYEMTFYTLFAIALLFRRGLILLIVMLLSLLVVGQLLNPIVAYVDPATAIGTWTDPLLLPFLIGLGLALLRRHRPDWRVGKPLAWVGAGVAGVLLVQALLVPEGSYPAWWRLTVLLLASAAASPAILARDDGWVPDWLVRCGNASYSLYLVHPLLFGIVKRFGGTALARLSAPAALVLFVAVSTVAGLVVHYVLERPLTALLARRLAFHRRLAIQTP